MAAWAKKPATWKTAAEVMRLTIPAEALERGGRGTIYVGKLKFKGTRTKRVAVKTFRHSLTNPQAAEYKKAIKDLLRANVILPKMGLVKHEGKWVLVSQLFLKRGESVLHWWPTTSEGVIKSAILLARTINAGYYPSHDFLEFKTQGTKHEIALPLDLDVVIKKKGRPIEEKIGRAVDYLIAPGIGTKDNVSRFLEIFIYELAQKYKKIAETILAQKGRKI